MGLPQVSGLQLTFSGGIDESTRAELLEPGSAWKTLENLRQDKRGGATCRLGFASMTRNRYGGTARSAGLGMFARGILIGVIDGSQVDLYDSGKSTWKTLGRVPEADYRLTPLPSAGMATAATEIAYANGYIAIVYAGTAGNATTAEQFGYASIVNATTGAIVRVPEQIGSAVASPGFALINVTSYSDRYFIAFYSEGTGGSGGTITAYYLDTNTAATIQAGWTLIGTVSATWDDLSTPAVESLSNRVAIAYGHTAGGTDRLTVKTYTIAGNTETRNVGTSSTSVTAIAMAGTVADTLWVAWNQTTAVKVIGLDADALAVDLATTDTIITTAGAPEEIQIAINTSVAGNGRLYARDGNVSYMCGFETNAGAAAIDGAQTSFYGTYMSARPRMYAGRYYANFRTEDNAVLCDWTDDVSYVRPIANVAPGLVTAEATFGQAGAGLDVLSGTNLYAVVNIQKSASAFAPTLVTYDLTSSTRWHAVHHNGATLLGGGTVFQVAGGRVHELGYLSRPIRPTTSVGGTGISLTTGRRYVAVYEEVDGAGNWAVSGISDPSLSTGAVSNKTITVSTSPLAMSSRLATTDRVTGTRVVFYATLDGGLPPYYRLGTSYNTTTAAVTFADTTSDATLGASTKLYAPSLAGIGGGAQARLAPPGLTWLCIYNGMVVGAFGDSLYYSGQEVPGEATWFNPIFQLPVGGDGDITGLAAQDGTLYVFTRRAIYAVVGEAPSDNAAAGGLGVPRRLAVDVGCISGRSVVVTSLGIFFQSERGIELLTRAQSVTWVGEKVQETLASYPQIASAQIDASQSVVYFECAATETDGVYASGRTLVFDLSLQVWISVDRRADATGTADSAAQASCILWTGSAYRYAWLQSNGTVRYETTSYLDEGDSANAWVTMRAETPKIRVAGLQANHQVLSAVLLAERHTNHQTRINVAYDDSTTWTDSETWTATETAALTREQLEIECSKEQIMSVQIRLEDLVPSNTTATPVTTGKGATWVGLALNIGANDTGQATTLLPAEHRK